MKEIDHQLDEMLNKIKEPGYVNWYGSSGKLPLIYESPDGGKTVYARPFGSTPDTRRLVKGENYD